MDHLNKSGEDAGEMEDTNLITLLKNPQKFKEIFSEMQKSASQSLKSQQYDKALKALNKCSDMLDLGKNILKDVSKYTKLCINANIACAYQGTWKMQKCNKFCEKAEEELQKLLQSADSKQNYLNLSKSLIKIRFQHCAILSQLNQHQKALDLCKATLKCLTDYMKAILQYVENINALALENFRSSETVQFCRQVREFAARILQNLLKKMDEPLTAISQSHKSSFYYWQKNPQNNQDQVKKRFVAGKPSDECKRSILGVNKINHWIDQFNIGTIMHMSELSIKDFESSLPIEEYIFKDKLYETVIYCSVAHFTIATEMRFIESNKDKVQPNVDKSEDNSTNVSSIIKKYGFKEKSQMFMMSQLYHFRAIQIIAENIRTTVPYISHLIKSYDKHYIYKKQLQPVVAIEEESLLSLNEVIGLKSKESKIEEQIIDDEDIYYAEEEPRKDPKIITVGKIHDDAESIDDHKSQASASKDKQNEHEDDKVLDILKPVIKSKQKKDKKRNKSEGKPRKSNKQIKRQKVEDKNQREKKIKIPKDKEVEKEKEKPLKIKDGKDLKLKSLRTTGQKKLKEDQEIKYLKSPREEKQGKSNQARHAKQQKRKKNDEIGEVRINHQSCTQIKLLVFKNKK